MHARTQFRMSALSIALLVASDIACASPTQREPGCTDYNVRECVQLAIDAMGGRQKLEAIHTLSLDVIGHTQLMEQSYRQAPFITAYERDKLQIDFANQLLRDDSHSVWPESDPHQAESDQTLIVDRAGGGFHDAKGDSPCGLAALDEVRQALALGPLRVLLTAMNASDLRYAEPEMLRSSQHATIAFSWNGVPVRVLLNGWNHLPDAVETTQQFHDFWYFWGDTLQRVDWDNWKYVAGVAYPSNEIVERNGAIWKSSQALDVVFNPSFDEHDFTLDPAVAILSAQGKGWARPFHADKTVALADGITLYPGSWNATVVRQNDGIVILETPISSTYTQGLFEQAKRQYTDLPVKAVLSTSDSWPHVGGIRYDVAQAVPTYILDLNQALLDRIAAAPHTIDPDALQTSPRKPQWKIVAHTTTVGSGSNRMLLIPLRGAVTERQYMVYFPEHRLLYASDTLVIDPDQHTLYDSELMHEVQQAVEREHLQVDTVYAMHQQPTPWKDVLDLLRKSASSNDVVSSRS